MEDAQKAPLEKCSENTVFEDGYVLNMYRGERLVSGHEAPTLILSSRAVVGAH